MQMVLRVQNPGFSVKEPLTSQQWCERHVTLRIGLSESTRTFIRKLSIKKDYIAPRLSMNYFLVTSTIHHRQSEIHDSKS